MAAAVASSNHVDANNTFNDADYTFSNETVDPEFFAQVCVILQDSPDDVCHVGTAGESLKVDENPWCLVQSESSPNACTPSLISHSLKRGRELQTYQLSLDTSNHSEEEKSEEPPIKHRRCARLDASSRTNSLALLSHLRDLKAGKKQGRKKWTNVRNPLVVQVHRGIRRSLELNRARVLRGGSAPREKCKFIYNQNKELFDQFGIESPNEIGTRLRDIDNGSSDYTNHLSREIIADLYRDWAGKRLHAKSVGYRRDRKDRGFLIIDPDTMADRAQPTPAWTCHAAGGLVQPTKHSRQNSFEFDRECRRLQPQCAY